MKENKKILDLFMEELWGLLGDDVTAYNELYDALIFYVTDSVNTHNEVGPSFDLCVVFLTALKNCLNEVLFNNEK